MKVIDFHVHVFKKEDWNEEQYRILSDIGGKEQIENIEKIMEPDKFSEFLGDNGVSKAVILAESSPAVVGMIRNEYVIDFSNKSGVLIPFCSINPNFDFDPVGKLGYLVEDLGAMGLKLLPSYQYFFPNEARMYNIYARAEELKIPVMFHTGSSLFKYTRMKYCDPIYFDDVAVDFPKLKIVMAHSGRGFDYEKAFFLSRLHKNIFMEISGLPPNRLLDLFLELEKNADKVIFGSDYPATPKGIKWNIETIKNLPLSSHAIEKILYKNAEKVLFG